MGEKEFGVMKEYFLNFMICICVAGTLVSLICFAFALIDWNELDFWKGLALVLMNGYGLAFWTAKKQEE